MLSSWRPSYLSYLIERSQVFVYLIMLTEDDLMPSEFFKNLVTA